MHTVVYNKNKTCVKSAVLYTCLEFIKKKKSNYLDFYIAIKTMCILEMHI